MNLNKNLSFQIYKLIKEVNLCHTTHTCVFNIILYMHCNPVYPIRTIPKINRHINK